MPSPTPIASITSALGTMRTTLGVDEVAELYGMSRWTIYEQANAGTLPVLPLRIGRTLRWPTVAVLRSLGVEPTDASPTASPAA